MIEQTDTLAMRIVNTIDRIHETMGRVLGLAVLVLIMVQFFLVIGSAAFSYGSVWLQESRLYLNALIFLGGAGYAMTHNAHVRVDLFFRDTDNKTRAWVDLLGCLLFLIPFLFLIWWAGIPYVLDSIKNAERSIETGGIPFVYGLKGTILLFSATLSFGTIAMLVRASTVIFAGRDEEGRKNGDEAP